MSSNLKNVYRYYGVTEEDKISKSARYEKARAGRLFLWLSIAPRIKLLGRMLKKIYYLT